MVRFMLTRWAISSHPEVQCDYALVALDSDSKERFEKLMKICEENDVQSLELYDYKNRAVFLDEEKIIDNYGFDEPFDFEEFLGDKTQVEITEEQYDDWEDRFSHYVESGVTEVWKDMFLFKATLKYGNTSFQTKSFELKDF
jgi:hypothetical protein